MKYYAVRKGINPGIYTSWDECSSNVKGFPGAEYKSFSSKDDATSYMTLEASNITSKSGKSNKKSSVQDVVLSDDEYVELQNKAHEYLSFLKDNDLILSSTYEQVSKQIDTNIRIKKERQSYLSQRGGKPIPTHVDVFVDGSYNAATNEYGYGVYMTDGESQQIYYGRGLCMEGGRNVEGEIAAAKVAIGAVARNPYYSSMTVYHDYQGIGSWADKTWQANKSYNQSYALFVESIRKNGLSVEFVHVDGHTGVEGNEYVDKLAKIGCGMKLTVAEESFLSQLQNVPGYPVTRDLPELDDGEMLEEGDKYYG